METMQRQQLPALLLRLEEARQTLALQQLRAQRHHEGQHSVCYRVQPLFSLLQQRLTLIQLSATAVQRRFQRQQNGGIWTPAGRL